jgi:CelD/BcsL family acetyltransferase involved in cellulose biosynthesis
MAHASLDCTAVPESTVVPKVAHVIKPLLDARWDGFLRRHSSASVFHSTAWLNALSRTYGYESIAYTTSSPGQDLENALVFCRVESWLTGRRLVSLPFSDHCDPLVTSNQELAVLTGAVEQECRLRRWSYLEMRPLCPIEMATSLRNTEVAYAFHRLDLEPSIDSIFGNFHKSSIQRKIRRADRERLQYCEGSDEALLHDFYKLFELTRRRHGSPPQPRKWFSNLKRCFGKDLKVRIAYRDHQALAAMITIRHKKTMVYKYGCSDSRFNNLGGMHFLFWRTIQEAKSEGLDSLDFGRTDANQQGLITFKNRWGAKQSVLTYSRFSPGKNATHFFDLAIGNLKAQAVKSLISYLPAKMVSRIGQMLYGHVG